MQYDDRTKIASFTAIGALCALLIAIIANHNAFPELLFHSIVGVLITVIVIFVAYAFLWQRSVLYIRSKMWTRKQNRLSQKYFGEWRDHVNNFASLKEFENVSLGITGILADLIQKNPPEPIASLVRTRIENFSLILRNPLSNFKQRTNNLHWHKKKMLNCDFLSSLVKEFENYVEIHKRLYVDFAVTISAYLQPPQFVVPKKAKRSYSRYKDNYNQFVVAYLEFAKKCARDELRIFSTTLEKAYEWEE